MSAAPSTRRAAAEIEGQAAQYRIGNRSIHQYWHMFAAHFRHVLLAPQRRPDSGRVAWTWREETEARPVTATELTEVRRRLSEAVRSLTRGFGGLDREEASETGAESLDGQVRAAVGEMVAQLVAQRDAGLAAFVCRTDAGLMLHSWGASSAAKPYFPDAQNGEISGNVVVGAEKPSGVGVILENAQGAVVMRTQSEHDGVFRFLHVAPGNYRVRVMDRSEFPAEGIAVTLERESVTGLELRGTAAATEEKNPPMNPPSADHPPWYRRKWVAASGVLVVLGIGGCIWNSSRTSSGKIPGKTTESSWQSASGQLASTDGTNGVRDDRKVGSDGAFSSLSRTLPPPKTRVPARGPRDASDKAREGKASANNPDSAEEQSDSVQKNQSPEQQGDAGSHDTSPKAGKPPAFPESASHSSSEKKVGEESTGTEAQAGDEGKPLQADKPPPDAHRTAEKKPVREPDAPSAGAAHPAASPNSPPGSPANSDSLKPSAEFSPNGQATSPGKTKGPPASQSNPGSLPTDTRATEDAPGASDNSENKAPDGSDKASKTNPKSSKTSGVSPNNPARDGTANQSPPSETLPVPSEESAAANATNQTNSPSRSPEKKAAQAKPATKPNSQESEAGDVDAAPDGTDKPPQNKTTKSSASSGKKGGSPTTSANGVAAAPTSSSSTDAAGSASAGSGEETGKNAPPSANASAKQKGPDADAPLPLGVETEVAPEQPTRKETANAAPVQIAGDAAELIYRTKIRAAPWKARLTQDLIIPTRPLTAREEEQLDALRQKLQQERVARMPRIFQHPQMKSGVIVELPGGDFSTPGSIEWRDENGRLVEGAFVRGNVAGLEWDGPSAPRGISCSLTSRQGKVLARAEVDPGGLVTFKSTPQVSLRYWVGIETALPAEAVRRSPLEWRQTSGEAIPATWLRDDGWRAGKGQRIEIPLDEAGRRIGHYGISLVDSDSGWALAGDIAIQ